MKKSVSFVVVFFIVLFLFSCNNNDNIENNINIKTTSDLNSEETTIKDNESISNVDIVKSNLSKDEIMKNLEYDNIEYLGHGSLKMFLKNGKICYIDPYAGDDYNENADLILVTHEHMDHNKIDLVPKNDDCQIIRSKDCIVNGGYKTFDIFNMHIEPVQAYNSNHKVNACVGFVITSNNKKIYVAGDTSKTDQMELLGSYGIDYAFLPMDGIFNMDINEAMECEKLIKAKHTIPYHLLPGELYSEERANKFITLSTLIVRPNEIIEIK